VKQGQLHQSDQTNFKEIANKRIKLEGSYDSNGLYQGTHRFWNEYGRITFETEFINGMQISAKEYFPSGKIESEKHYQIGLPHGPQRKWFPGGELKIESNYVKGVMHGTQKTFYAGGSVKSEKLFEKGSLVKTTEWDIHGKER